MSDDTQFVLTAIKQIATIVGLPEDSKFSDLKGYRVESTSGVVREKISAQSAVMQRAQSLKEFKNTVGYIRIN